MNISPDMLVSEYFRLTPIQKEAFKKMGIKNLHDLLHHFPVRYGDTAETRSIDSLSKGDTAVIYGKITGLKASKGFKTKMTMTTARVEDESASIQCVWFNQPYIAKMTPEGAYVRIEGKVSQRKSKAPAVLAGGESSLDLSETKRRHPVGWADGGQSTLAPREDGNSSGTTLNSDLSNNTQGGALYLSNPKIEVVNKLPIGVGDSLFGDQSEAHTMYPVYPESRGITSTWIYHAIQKIFKSGLLDTIPEYIPADILEKYHLPSIKTALIWIHTPLKQDDAVSARKRFAFEEIFTIQLATQQTRKTYEEYPAFKIATPINEVREFVKRFPFEATEAQYRAIEAIITDMSGERPMSRLLEGDVGSGKTAVAAATAYAVMTAKKTGAPQKEQGAITTDTTQPIEHNRLGEDGASIAQSQQTLTRVGSNRLSVPVVVQGNLQIAYMCPTEILATQHFESFIQYFSYMPIQIGLITGSGCRKFPSKINPKGWTDISRAQLLKWVASSEINVLIGTHALIQSTVKFKNLSLVIIDEQHRFGTAQRRKMIQKNSSAKNAHAGIAPHLLSMTATPIPRTLALTMYGDLDLTLLDQSPAGRKPIITELIIPAKRDDMYTQIRRELEAGRQLYVICPRIDEPDPDKEAAIIAKSVKEEAKRLKKDVFQEYEIGVLHSKMKPDEKDRVMLDFKNGKIDILCATSVVEVGVNVPNATVIIIEGAERFGLAQLHQLRGRVMRSSHQAYCFVFTETTSAKSIDRLKALQTAKNGFELAELDLAQRGAGELSGIKQWGVSDIAMEALKNLKMVEAARTEAHRLIQQDASLNQYPLLKEKVNRQRIESHFE
ncbi:MAG: ATP-dependent DNA helicase RecG [Candidatus Taylorbacteria bacterium]